MKVNRQIIAILQIPASFVLSVYAFWIVLAVSAGVLGLYCGGRKLNSLLSGVYSAIGVVLAVFVFDSGNGISQASLFSSAAGIPGGIGFPILLTILIAFFLGLLAYLLGSSFELGGSSGTANEKPEKSQ